MRARWIAGYAWSMSRSNDVATAAAALTARSGEKPLVGVVLGSGLGAFGERLQERVAYEDIPGMPTAHVAGHPGFLRFGRVGGTHVACLQGRVHLYEGYSAETVVFPVRLLAALGCRAVLLTNAAGGISGGLAAGDRMLIVDHLNLTGSNPLVGAGQPLGRSPFIDMGHAYDARFGELAAVAAADVDVALKRGVYAGLLGPSYETPAEIRMLRAMGADAVGMSTVLEVIALRQLGVRVGAISCITNLAAGISTVPLDHAEVQAIAALTAPSFVALLERWTALVGQEVAA
jgi:purine-nucleoside phosphorylase